MVSSVPNSEKFDTSRISRIFHILEQVFVTLVSTDPVKRTGKDAPTDEELVQAAQQALPGDYRHFETLVKRHQGSILANCRFIVGTEQGCEDLAQEVFIKAFFGLGGFAHRSRFKTWIQRIKVNHCLDHVRKVRNRREVDVDSSEIRAEVEQKRSTPPKVRDLESNPSLSLVRSVLVSLPESSRIPLVMCDADGFSYQEIADTLGLGLSATKMRVKRARAEFRRLYAMRKSAEA